MKEKSYDYHSKYIVVLFVLVIVPKLFHGQDNTDLQVRVATPKIQEFENQENIDLNYYEGQPNIFIPIWTITEGDIDIPISLTYNATGHKVSQEASWVGLGWNLSFGSITQVTNDKDDFSGYPKIIPDYFKHYEPRIRKWTIDQLDNENNYPPNIAENIFPMWQIEGYFWPINGSMTDVTGLLDNQNGDTEHDIFKANFQGHYLEMILNKENNYAIVLNEKNYKVELINPGLDNPSWKITTPKGIDYVFEEVIVNDSPRMSWILPNCGYTSQNFSSNNVFDYDDLNQSGNFGNGIYSGSYEPDNKSRIWLITEVIDVYGNNVLFEYDNSFTLNDFNLLNEWHIGEAYSEIFSSAEYVGPWMEGHNVGYCDRPIPNKYESITFSKFKHSFIYTRSTGRYLKSIIYNRGESIIDFNTSNREDYLNSQKLDGITIKNNGQLKYKVDFLYDYYTSDYDGYGKHISWKSQDELTKRLKLESIIINSNKNYTFIYDPIKLPPKNSYATDYWGFFNGMMFNKSLVPNPNRFDFNFWAEFSNPMLANTDNHSSHPEFCQAGILKQIIYPTGGYRRIEYELNSFNNFVNGIKIPNYDNINFENQGEGYYTHGNGLRVKSITSFDNNGITLSKTNYSYKEGKSLRPFLSFKQYADKIYKHTQYDGIRTDYKNLVLNESNRTSPTSLGNNNGVGYDKVIIEKLDNHNNNNGILEFHFINAAPYIQTTYYNQFFNMPSSQKDYANGKKVKEIYLNNYEDTIKKIEYQYEFRENGMRYYGTMHNLLGVWANRYYDGFGQGQFILFNKKRNDLLGFYPIYSGKVLLKQKTAYYYTQQGKYSEIEEFIYDQGNLLSKRRILDKYNEGIQFSYLYPKHHNYVSFTSPEEENVFIQLLNNNRRNIILETNKSNWPSGSLLHREVNIYQNLNGLTVPFTIRKGVFDTNSYYETIKFNNYNTRGKLTEYFKFSDAQSSINSIVYGYEENYPVIIAENTNEVDLIIAINDVLNAEFPNFSSLDQILETLDFNEPIDYTILGHFIESLNSHPTLNQCSFTFYTHDPLAGVTSITDPRGQTQFYEYDGMNRLIRIKDHEGNIVEEYEYNYVNQQ